MLDRIWKTLDNVQADVISTIRSELAMTPDAEVLIGTDSQQMGIRTEYVTVLVIVRPGKGARVLFTKERVPRIRSLRERLVREAWLSTDLAMQLTSSPDIGEAILENGNLSIHIDANPDPKHKSSAYVQELAGLVVGQGFKAVLKPDSWAAAHAADHAVKQKNQKYAKKAS